ncbi:hypothetical protein M413DRAFT_447799 [Hebeloma cylindrosporum]|uniref:Uncharacterized protein n=1 Tax=Hebeloma cylindrosporum TaxID=76867 RepID=A0A0C3BPS2_HEBCY|nr:hypothetical protein M413DRAFT_447799 [Hebeloma cylindrosporum h7]
MATKVVFPAPPLTTNKLTAQQRTHLVRKARKIEQLLGSTPRLIDTSVRTLGPINVTLSPGPSQHRLTQPSQSSFGTVSSGSSSSSSNSFSSLSRTTSLSSALYSLGHKRGTSAASLNLNEDWPCDIKVPILRLPFESLSTAALGYFIHDDCGTGSVPQLRSTCDDLSPNQSTLSPTIVIDISPQDSATVSMSTTPSPNSIRKQKMDRLRRKLGSCVPLDLVFPSIAKDAPDSSTGTGMNPLLVTASHDSHQQIKSTAGTARFTEARDPAMSLSDAIAASVALARSQNLGSPSSPPKHNVRQKRPRSAPAAEFRLKERLSLIMESPEEHRLSCSDSRDLERSEDLESQPATELGANSTVCPGQVSKRPTTAPASISTSKSAGGSPPLERSLKRRPSSYRKPPPPIPADLEC